MLAPGALPRLKSAKINLLLVDSFAHVDFFFFLGWEARTTPDPFKVLLGLPSLPQD